MSESKTMELKNAGLKATTPRLKILELFQQRTQSNLNRHLSAEDVYKALVDSGDDIGLATVYRVLSQFEQAGIIVRHHFEPERATYELENNGHHDHIVCLECNDLIEFMDPEIEKAQRAIARRYGYLLCDHSLVLYGVCPACQRKEHGESAESSEDKKEE